MVEEQTRFPFLELTSAESGIPLRDRLRTLNRDEFKRCLHDITRQLQGILGTLHLIHEAGLEERLNLLLRTMSAKIAELFHADRSTIFLVNHAAKELWSTVAQGSGDDVVDIRIALGAGIAGHIAATGEGENIPDAYDHPRFSKEVDIQTGYRTRSILCMPVFDVTAKDQPDGRRVVAVVQLLNRAGDEPFSAQDQSDFEDLAPALGIILDSYQQLHRAAQNQRGLGALMKATRALAQALDLDTTLRVVIDQARELIGADGASIFLLDRAEGELWTKIAKNTSNDEGGAVEEAAEIRIPMSKGIAGFVATQGVAVNIPDAYQDSRFDPTNDQRTNYRTRNILCVPIFNSQSVLIGVTQLINKHLGSFSSSDEEFLRAFNIQAGIALENAQLFENVLVERQYQKDILRSLTNAVITTNRDGAIVTLNDSALALLGHSGEELKLAGRRAEIEGAIVGRPITQVIPLSTLPTLVTRVLERGSNEYVAEQELNLWPSGKSPESGPAEVRRSVNVTLTPLARPDGQVRGALVVLEDISQEKRMKAALYRYMTPTVAERVMEQRDELLMVGERRQVSILFSDIRGYTTLTEKLDAAEVVHLLNEYFETMVEAVFNHDGTLDKFIGDAIMAVFGAPLPLHGSHALKAVETALEMRERLADFNALRVAKQQPPIAIGIGLSSGEVVAGNIGSRRRMDYTVIGDGVNLSSRLEGVTKEYGCDIVLSETTYEMCKDHIRVRELDRIRVKGKNRPVSIYELLSKASEAQTETDRQFFALFERGREAYLGRTFPEAIALFTQALALRPDDKTSQLHLERSQDYLEAAPPPDWDGVHTMKSK
jgi:adenylate cyclase